MIIRMTAWFGAVWLVVLPSACTFDTAPSESERKAAVVSTVERGWNRGEVEAFQSAMADSVIFNYGGTPRPMSLDQMGAAVLRWREALPDLEMEIEELVAEDAIVAARLTLSGTHRGPWRGVEPTGKHVSMALMMFFRFEDGKVVELWEVDDQLGFRRQLGIEP